MSEFADCPFCGKKEAGKVSFTWWGGLIGPKILNHVKCLGCGKKYNGKTGSSNIKGIIMYSTIVLIIGFFVFFFIGILKQM